MDMENVKFKNSDGVEYELIWKKPHHTYNADPMQTDLKNGNRGGFVKLYDVFNNQESRDMGIHTFEFSEEDIVRSELTKFIVSKLAECETI